jgi:hypothetical protein
MYFAQFANALSFEFDLHKESVGVVSTLSIVLPMGTQVQIEFNELDFDKRACVRSRPYYPPIDRNGRARFLDYVLNFNRNALSYLDMGLMPAPTDDKAFMPTWYAPRKEETYISWNAKLGIFEGLVANCNHNIQKMMNEWTNYAH